MLGRVPIRDAHSIDDVIAFIESSDDDKVIIFDVDNTVAPQGTMVDDFGALVNAAIDRFEASPNVARVIALTNGTQREVPRLVSGGNKPWTTRRRLGLRGSRESIVVVGDQVLTDGLLAWRLRGTFLHLVIDDETEDRTQATMRRIGRVVLGMFLRREGELT